MVLDTRRSQQRADLVDHVAQATVIRTATPLTIPTAAWSAGSIGDSRSDRPPTAHGARDGIAVRSPLLMRPHLFPLLLTPMLDAQEPRVGTRIDGGPPLAQIGRVATENAPRIDGHLDDRCWQEAPELQDLVMVEPWEGRAPTHRTVVKLLHDRHHLFLSIRCDDSDVASIRATQRARDAALDPDDRVEFMFDPFENRRTAYWFQIGAAGSLGDAVVSQNGNRFDKPWDALWSGEARITANGWQAEVAIPFRSIPRKTGATRWGFNLRRLHRAHNEEYRWANPVQAVPFFRISELGTLSGFGEIDEGLGLDVVPYVAVDVRREPAVDRDFDVDPDLGGDLFYRITPELTLAATAFTDFAETENDARLINLNRFPLFLPEKRDFFLEGASYFTFGAGTGLSSSGNPSFLPFFSRRIGLDSAGQPIPLIAGIKLTGEAGPFEIGLLDVETDSPTPESESRNLAVMRLKYALATQTTIGLVA